MRNEFIDKLHPLTAMTNLFIVNIQATSISSQFPLKIPKIKKLVLGHMLNLNQIKISTSLPSITSVTIGDTNQIGVHQIAKLVPNCTEMEFIAENVNDVSAFTHVTTMKTPRSVLKLPFNLIKLELFDSYDSHYISKMAKSNLFPKLVQIDCHYELASGNTVQFVKQISDIFKFKLQSQIILNWNLHFCISNQKIKVQLPDYPYYERINPHLHHYYKSNTKNQFHEIMNIDFNDENWMAMYYMSHLDDMGLEDVF
eukprot:NODE_366_length_8705_cov_0.466070.p3 type:complete len:255 gc:universal NODE_366_length_8705_cov_0.466070:3482-4246(+)